MSEPSPNPAEKRSEPRAITDVAMEVYDMATRQLVGIGRLMNLSTSSACVETTTSMKGRGPLFVRLLLNNRLVAAPASVIWEKVYTNTMEYGLKFGPYAEEMRDVVSSFIKENLAYYKNSDPSLSPPPGEPKP